MQKITERMLEISREADDLSIVMSDEPAVKVTKDPSQSASSDSNITKISWLLTRGNDESIFNLLHNNQLKLDRQEQLITYGIARLTKNDQLVQYFEDIGKFLSFQGKMESASWETESTQNLSEFIQKDDKQLLESIIPLAIDLQEHSAIELLVTQYDVKPNLTKEMIAKLIEDQKYQLLGKLVGNAYLNNLSKLSIFKPHSKEQNHNLIKALFVVELICKYNPNLTSSQFWLFYKNLSENYNIQSELELILGILIKFNKNTIAQRLIDLNNLRIKQKHIEIALQANNIFFLFPFYAQIKKIITESHILTNLINYLLEGLKNPDMIEFKLHLLENVIPHISFSQAKRLLSLLEELFLDNSIRNKLFFTVNPFKIIILLIKIITEVKRKKESISYMCLKIKDKFIAFGVMMQEGINEYEEMDNIVHDKDLDERTVLSLIGELEVTQFLDHPIMHGIINDQWNSEYEINGKLSTISTSSRIIFEFQPILPISCKQNDPPEILDTELILVDNASHNQKKILKDYAQSFHLGMLEFWKDSALMKYSISTIFAIAITIYFTILASLAQETVYKILTYMDSDTSSNLDCLISYISTSCSYSEATYKNLLNQYEAQLYLFYKYLQYLYVISITLLFLFIRDIFQLIYLYVNKYNIRFMITHNLICYIKDLMQLIASIWVIILYSGAINQRNEVANKYKNEFLGKIAGFRFIGENRLDLTMSLELAITWFGLLLYFKILPIIGPLIKTFAYMFTDIIKFLLIYVVELMAFSCVSYIAFRDLYKFSSFVMSLQTLFESSLGNFDYEWFTPYNQSDPFYNKVGRIYLTIFLIINLLLLINLLIALFSDTYSKVQEKAHSLFLLEFLAEFPNYSSHPQTSSMVSTFFPLDVALSPIFLILLMQQPKTRLILNKYILWIEYIPVFLLVFILYLIIQIIQLPFAYLINLILIPIKSNESKSRIILKFIYFLFIGIFILIGYSIRDIYWFTIALITGKQSQLLNKSNKEITIYDEKTVQALANFFKEEKEELFPLDQDVSKYFAYLNEQAENTNHHKSGIIGNILKPNTESFKFTHLETLFEKATISLNDGRKMVYLAALNHIFQMLQIIQYQKIHCSKTINSCQIIPTNTDNIKTGYFSESIKILKLERVQQTLQTFYQVTIDAQNKVILHEVKFIVKQLLEGKEGESC